MRWRECNRNAKRRSNSIRRAGEVHSVLLAGRDPAHATERTCAPAQIFPSCSQQPEITRSVTNMARRPRTSCFQTQGCVRVTGAAQARVVATAAFDHTRELLVPRTQEQLLDRVAAAATRCPRKGRNEGSGGGGSLLSRSLLSSSQSSFVILTDRITRLSGSLCVHTATDLPECQIASGPWTDTKFLVG